MSMPTLHPEARVPRLRRDLTIYDAPAGTGEGRVKVESPASGAIIELRGFELSIARMLNGTRTVNEVVQAAGQIGLPITVDGEIVGSIGVSGVQSSQDGQVAAAGAAALSG